MSQNLDGWLARKYDILQEHGDAALKQGDAALIKARSGANLEDQQSGQVAPDSAARRALEGAQGGYLNTQGRVLQSNELDPINAWEAHQGQQDLLNRRYPLGLVPSNDPYSSTPRPNTNTSGSDSAISGALGGNGYAKGTPKVPGKGDGTVDKVPAMLAPGEAVLNAGAAEHFGRHNIAALNAVGQAKMQAGKGQAQSQPAGKGMPAPQGRQHFADGAANVQPSMDSRGSFSNGAIPTESGGSGSREQGVRDIQEQYRRFPTDSAAAKPQHFKGGTHMVGHGKSAQTPKIDPGVIQALMSMGPGGGTPPMGGGAPMMPPAPGMVPPGR